MIFFEKKVKSTAKSYKHFPETQNMKFFKNYILEALLLTAMIFGGGFLMSSALIKVKERRDNYAFIGCMKSCFKTMSQVEDVDLELSPKGARLQVELEKAPDVSKEAGKKSSLKFSADPNKGVEVKAETDTINIDITRNN